MIKYRARITEIEAVRFDGTKENLADMFRLSNEIGVYASDLLVIRTSQKSMEVHIGDWIIKNKSGKVFKCDDDMFKLTYELVEE